jgi:hypothetical protein
VCDIGGYHRIRLKIRRAIAGARNQRPVPEFKYSRPPRLENRIDPSSSSSSSSSSSCSSHPPAPLTSPPVNPLSLSLPARHRRRSVLSFRRTFRLLREGLPPPIRRRSGINTFLSYPDTQVNITRQSGAVRSARRSLSSKENRSLVPPAFHLSRAPHYCGKRIAVLSGVGFEDASIIGQGAVCPLEIDRRDSIMPLARLLSGNSLWLTPISFRTARESRPRESRTLIHPSPSGEFSRDAQRVSPIAPSSALRRGRRISTRLQTRALRYLRREQFGGNLRARYSPTLAGSLCRAQQSTAGRQ